MCGFVCEVNAEPDHLDEARLERALTTLAARGPDASGIWNDPRHGVWFGHRRLKIIDLSEAGAQPMTTSDGRYQLIYNGEIYNYLELRARLEGEYAFRSTSDSEVLIAAFAKWGADCLVHLRGMFAFAIWDTLTKRLFVARDRFGVKPVYWHATRSGVVIASEIKALHAHGVARTPDATTWASYLTAGLYDHGEATFWSGIRSLPAGHLLTWSADAGIHLTRWYDPADSIASGLDDRPISAVIDELEALMFEVIALRFRSDVPVGLCLSGGLDSSLLLAMTRRLYGIDAPIHTFTFFTGEANYDELPWVDAALRGSGQLSHKVLMTSDEIPELARRVQDAEDEPFGGFPTLGMAKVHDHARSLGITVLLDGNGMDEAWAGYDYYARAIDVDASLGPVQGSRDQAVRADCVRPDFRTLSQPFVLRSFGDPVFDLQYRDLTAAKIPRAMRFADRVSMMFSRELREPFLDHRLVELGLRQPADRKVRNGVGKWLVREMAAGVLPSDLREAPKRPVQTPQREWLRGPLAGWAKSQIDLALDGWGREWLIADEVRAAWTSFERGAGDNSFPIWQWISLGLLST